MNFSFIPRSLRIPALLLLLLPAACAWTEGSVEVRYGTVAPAAPVAGAASVAVTVVGQDARTTRQDRISAKRNTFGTEGAKIVASNNIVQETERAIASELAARGFREGADARIQVEVVQFYNDFNMGWTITANAEVTLNIKVIGSGGQVAYQNTYTQRYPLPSLMVASGSNAAQALQTALQRTVQSVMMDQAFISSLLAQSPTARPAAPRRGRPSA